MIEAHSTNVYFKLTTSSDFRHFKILITKKKSQFINQTKIFIDRLINNGRNPNFVYNSLGMEVFLLFCKVQCNLNELNFIDQTFIKASLLGTQSRINKWKKIYFL